MKKQKIIICSCILILVLVGIGYIFWKGNIKEISEDARKFKEEYESLNNTIRESDGATYNSISIDIDNPIKYVDTEETINILKQKQAIIYIGAEWCPWCRNAIPTLFEVAKKYKVDTIYYLNLDQEKSSFEIQDGNLIQTKKGSDGYYRLLDSLQDYLKDYSLQDEKGKEYTTGEKRIFLPYVLGIKDGHVVAEHVGTVSLNSNQTKYDTLTEEQKEKLTSIYTNIFESVYKTEQKSCASHGGC